MKMNKNKILCCGDYGCYWNCDGCCSQDVIALDTNGKCTLTKPRPVPKDTAVAQNKTKTAFDMEASK